MGGDMSRENRDETIKKFRKGEIQILITTDLLDRGYDERLFRLVINFDLPVKRGPFGNEANYETYFIDLEELEDLELKVLELISVVVKMTLQY